jgi:hypothetical protein
VAGLADRERGARPDVIPSRHEDVWDYGGEAAWFKDSEGNLVGVVPASGEPAKLKRSDRTFGRPENRGGR